MLKILKEIIFFILITNIFSSELTKEKLIALKFNSKVSGILPADKLYITYTIVTNSEKLIDANSLNRELFLNLKKFYEENFGIKTGIAKKTISKVIYKTGKNKGKFFYRVKIMVLSKAKNFKGANLLLENLNSSYIENKKVYYSFSKIRIKQTIDKITITAMRKARIKINKDLSDRNMKLVKTKNTKYSLNGSKELKYGTKEQIEKFSNRKDIKIFNIILSLEYYAKKINVEETIDKSIYW